VQCPAFAEDRLPACHGKQASRLLLGLAAGKIAVGRDRLAMGRVRPIGGPDGRCPTLPIEKFSLIRAVPLTGRTHQIRVHLSSLGHPIVGDKIYGSNERFYLEFIENGWTATLDRQLLLPRQALHSAKLAIDDDSGWTSPLPVDLAEFARVPTDCN